MASPKIRLIELPQAFLGVDALRHFDWDKQYGNKMLSSWVKQGVLDRLGPRLDVYAQSGRIPAAQRVDAMLDALPTGHYQVDANVFRNYGWSTQIAHRREEGVPSLSRTCDPREDLRLHARSRRWWSFVSPGMMADNEQPGMAAHLHPAWLLAESIFHPQSQWWSPDIDDLDIDSMEMDDAGPALAHALERMAKYYNVPFCLPDKVSIEQMHALARSAMQETVAPQVQIQVNYT